jgi:hypothetical protein
MHGVNEIRGGLPFSQVMIDCALVLYVPLDLPWEECPDISVQKQYREREQWSRYVKLIVCSAIEFLFRSRQGRLGLDLLYAVNRYFTV